VDNLVINRLVVG